MFDNITVEVLLPDMDHIDDSNFQTKALQNALEQYSISSTGQLVLKKMTIEETTDEEREAARTIMTPKGPKKITGPLVNLVGVVKQRFSHYEIVPFHGDIDFGDYIKGVHREYVARFNEGSLSRIWVGDDPGIATVYNFAVTKKARRVEGLTVREGSLVADLRGQWVIEEILEETVRARLVVPFALSWKVDEPDPEFMRSVDEAQTILQDGGSEEWRISHLAAVKILSY